jgi:hypothetical protein
MAADFERIQQPGKLNYQSPYRGGPPLIPTATPGLDLAHIKNLYEVAEQRYLESLPLEHFIESTPQAT